MTARPSRVDVCFVVGVAATASSGVQVLIPETGHAGREWIADVDSAGGLFLAGAALVTNTAGNFLGWGVATPLVAIAILTTRALPRWLGWFGLLVGLLAGWLGLLSPVSGLFEAISTLGFFGFFAFVLAMGISMLLRLRRTAEDRAGVPA